MSYDHYQVRVQELEKAIEDKDNEVLRGLKDSKKARIQGVEGSFCWKCNMISSKTKLAASPDGLGSTASQINEPLSSRQGQGKLFEFAGDVRKSDLTSVDTAKDVYSSMDKNTLVPSKVEHANVNHNREHRISEEEAGPRSYHPQLTACNLVRKKAAERTTNPVNDMPSTATVNIRGTTAVPRDERMPLVIEDTAECEPTRINIRRESSSHLSLNKSGNVITGTFLSVELDKATYTLFLCFSKTQLILTILKYKTISRCLFFWWTTWP